MAFQAVSSVALGLPQKAETWLFDCGEGTQHQILRSDLKISQIKRIFITHLHGDHIFGLMGLLASCGLSGHAESIAIYGPPGLDKYIKACMKYSFTNISYNLQFNTVEPGLIYENEEWVVIFNKDANQWGAFDYKDSQDALRINSKPEFLEA